MHHVRLEEMRIMENGTSDKRREILIIILTGIVIAFLIGGIASIVYPSLAAVHPKWTLFGSLILLLIATSILYVVLVSSVRRFETQVEFPLTFDRSTPIFVDLPHCPMNVNARVCFNKLPESGRKHLASYDTVPEFFGSELNRFIDHVIQDVLLETVVFSLDLSESKIKGYTRLLRKHFPLGVTENHFLKDWLDEIDSDRNIFVPHFKEIQTFGRNNSFFRIYTKGGTIEFSWAVEYVSGAWYSEAFLPAQPRTRDRLHDFEVIVSLLQNCSALKIFSAKVQDFVFWASAVEKILAKHDWRSSQNDRLIYLINRIR
jgi:hypothetical protein